MYWIRAINGDEFISKAKPSRDGWTMIDPTIITSIAQSMVLAPYGMMSKDPSIFLDKASVLHANEVTDIVVELYEASIGSTLDFVGQYFDKMVEKSIALAKTPINLPLNTPELLTETLGLDNSKAIAELSELMDETLGRPKEFSGVEAEKPRTRQQTIDNLVKLADAKGKGKKTGEA